MAEYFKERICKLSGEKWKQYNSFTKCQCDMCKETNPPKKFEFKPRQPIVKKAYTIPKVSKKRKVEMLQYSVLRTEFLARPENKICPITKQQTIEVHHTYCGKDRAKYYLDVSTWLAVSRDGHNWIHDKPKEAREKGYLK